MIKINLSKLYDSRYKKNISGSNIPSTKQLDNSQDFTSVNRSFFGNSKINLTTNKILY